MKINNGRIEKQQISKTTNVENPLNIGKWRIIEFFSKIPEN